LKLVSELSVSILICFLLAFQSLFLIVRDTDVSIVRDLLLQLLYLLIGLLDSSDDCLPKIVVIIY